MGIINFKKTPYLVLFIFLAGAGIGTAYAGIILPTITLAGNVLVTGDTTLQGDLTCTNCVNSGDLATDVLAVLNHPVFLNTPPVVEIQNIQVSNYRQVGGGFSTAYTYCDVSWDVVITDDGLMNPLPPVTSKSSNINNVGWGPFSAPPITATADDGVYVVYTTSGPIACQP